MFHLSNANTSTSSVLCFSRVETITPPEAGLARPRARGAGPKALGSHSWYRLGDGGSGGHVVCVCVTRGMVPKQRERKEVAFPSDKTWIDKRWCYPVWLGSCPLT